jgi:hypothetical protein
MDEIISYKMCAVKVRNAKLRNYLKSCTIFNIPAKIWFWCNEDLNLKFASSRKYFVRLYFRVIFNSEVASQLYAIYHIECRWQLVRGIDILLHSFQRLKASGVNVFPSVDAEKYVSLNMKVWFTIYRRFHSPVAVGMTILCLRTFVSKNKSSNFGQICIDTGSGARGRGWRQVLIYYCKHTFVLQICKTLFYFLCRIQRLRRIFMNKCLWLPQLLHIPGVDGTRIVGKRRSLFKPLNKRRMNHQWR